VTASTPEPRRSVARRSSCRPTVEGDGSGRRYREAIEGALLGVVLGERLDGAARAGDLGAVAAGVLSLAELAVTENDLYEGEVARAVSEHGDHADLRYGPELNQLFASQGSDSIPAPTRERIERVQVRVDGTLT